MIHAIVNSMVLTIDLPSSKMLDCTGFAVINQSACYPIFY
jgi:hypothetical protein